MKNFVRLALIGILAFTIVLISSSAAPVSAQDGEDCVNSYIVQDGDTLYGISRRYNVNLNELAAVNNITNIRLIYIGDSLCLDGLATALPPENGDDSEFGRGGPNQGNQPAPLPSFAVQANADIMIRDVAYQTDANGVYVVTANDRIYNLAAIFGVDQNALAAANNIGNPQVIFAGQELYIPAPTYSAPVPGTFPAIAMVPRVARPGETEILVRGANYPANVDVNIYAEKFSLGRISAVLDTVTTDSQGNFEATITVPASFADGGALDMRTVSISGRVDGNPGVFGAHFFLNLDWLDANNR